MSEYWYIECGLLHYEFDSESESNYFSRILAKWPRLSNQLFFFLFSDKDLDERAITNQWMNVLLEFIQSSAEPPDGRTEKLRVT